MPKIKWSEFPNGSIIKNGDAVVGLRDGVNVRLNATAYEIMSVDNIRIDGNTISSLNSNGDISLSPNGIGSVFVGSVYKDPNSSASMEIPRTAAGAAIRAYRFVNAAAATGFDIYHSRGTTIGAHAPLVNNDSMGSYRAFGSDGTNFVLAGQIQFNVDGVPSANVMPGKFSILTCNNLGTLTAAVVVDSQQRMGIGTNSPSGRLSVDNITINANTISSTNANGAINVTPNGTGDLVLDGLKWPQTDGTANQYLKTNGSGQLSFGSPSYEYIASQSITGQTEIVFLNLTSQYDIYKFYISNVVSDSGLNLDLEIQFSSDNGLTWDTGYTGNTFNFYNMDLNNYNTANEIAIALLPDSTPGLTGELTLFYPGDSMTYTSATWLTTWVGAYPEQMTGSGLYEFVAAHNAVRFKAAGGNFTGTITMYGIRAP